MNLDQLTGAERFALSTKLSGWGHQFALVAEVLGSVAFERRRHFGGELADDTDNTMWAQRARYCDAMDEMFSLASQVRAA